MPIKSVTNSSAGIIGEIQGRSEKSEKKNPRIVLKTQSTPTIDAPIIPKYFQTHSALLTADLYPAYG
jgi:hypothetical protein